MFVQALNVGNYYLVLLETFLSLGLNYTSIIENGVLKCVASSGEVFTLLCPLFRMSFIIMFNSTSSTLD